MPGRTDGYVIVHRTSGRVVSRHPGLADARAAWRKRAFPTKSLIKVELGSWAHTHMILPAAAAQTAARRRVAESAKRNRHA